MLVLGVRQEQRQQIGLQHLPNALTTREFQALQCPLVGLVWQLDDHEPIENSEAVLSEPIVDQQHCGARN